MFRLKAYLLGCNSTAEFTEQIRAEVKQRWSRVEGEYATLSAMRRDVLFCESDPVLVIASLHTIKELIELRAFCGTSAKHAILAVLDATADPGMLLEAMRAGATQIVQLPLDANDLSEALDCIGAAMKGDSQPSMTIAVGGATGGCGATTIAVNLADTIANVRLYHCILVELAMRLGTLATQLNVQPVHTIGDVAHDLNRLDDDLVQRSLTKVTEYLSILPGPHDLIATDLPDSRAVAHLLEILRHLAEVLVIDVPPSFDETYFNALTSADHAVLVVDQTVASIRGAQLVIQHLNSPIKPLVVVNRYDPKAKGLTAERIAEFLKPCEVTTVPSDDSVALASNCGSLLRVHDARSPALAAIAQLVQTFLPDPSYPDTSSHEPSMWGRLTNALSLS
jgi:pilus assembly protein CpaE